MNTNSFLAFDIGASSGRAILGTIKNEKVELTEIHRFTNQMTRLHGNYFWNIYSLFDELKLGLKKCISEYKIQPDTIGIDTWGVDYSLISGDKKLIGLPFAYRDHRTDNSINEFFKLLSKKETYFLTGIQFLQFNTLFQLFSSVEENFSGLKIAANLLFTPDTLNFLFTGKMKNEYTIASTSQLLKPGLPLWEQKLFDVAGIPKKLMGEIIQPGTTIGNLLPEVSEETGSSQVPCVAVASHDTASAIVSVPADGDNWAFLSSGTWSLLGIESPVPLVSDKSLEMNFTNEGGVEGTTRFLKNIMGMWLIQECKRIWDNENVLSWQEIVDLSDTEEPFKSLINPDDPSFLNPGNMPKAIQDFCKQTGQIVPGSKGEIARCIYDSLVLKYKFTLKQIESITGRKIEKLHIIGGGAHNKVMNQLTANAIGIPVLAGPTEATAIGNIMMQAKAAGVVESLNEIRKVVKNSFDVIEYYPSPKLDWEKAYSKFEKLN
ncbi:MAG: rhamnulokinase [Prolixibacteraceae bacterium]|jgi:rhamnulokinase|nr:rhamnulokinase [Prolixibacteraceae bacterium]MBT6997388.1 rhamnulokinase [Prolixibacteraceae bacterium]MBT7396599.1 rhamnulokinase [Prolixibacteraceae bacterium]